MDQKKTDLQRRLFLLSAGVGGAGAVAIAASKAGVASPPATAAAAEGGSRGYSETAHVRNYYRTTRI